MSAISETGEKGLYWAPALGISRIVKVIESFFKTPGAINQARIWHGEFSYKLVQNTAIRSFQNMSPVTFIEAGDFYVCIFERAGYRGNYLMIRPGEKMPVTNCLSAVISRCRFSVHSVIRTSAPPQGYWEMDGPMYMMHFSAGYRFVS